MNNQITINKENILNAYNKASGEQKALLENMFGKDMFQPKDIKERVKTFTDALRVLGTPEELISDDFFKEQEKLGEDVVAMLKLRVIAEALNDGWKPTFDGSRCRYYPWFYIYTKEEYEKLNKDEKKKCRVVSRSSNYANAYGGVVYSYAFGASSVSHTHVGSRIVFKTRELAEYCEKQFIDIWEKFLFA